MKYNSRKKILLLLSLWIFCAIIKCQPIKKTVKQQIEPTFQLEIQKSPKQTLKSQKMNTTIPTTLHLDLLRNNQIQDPFLADNYMRLKWVSSCDVSYSKNITFNKEIMNSDIIQLVFEGIDTYSTIYLNQQKITETENAFLQYRVKLNKSNILPGNNTLKIEIRSTQTHDNEGQKSNRMPFEYAHTRKPCYQYSWDWAPYLNTMGIWKPIYIYGYSHMAIDFVWARNRQIHDKQAIINFAIALYKTQTSFDYIGKYKIKITNNNNGESIQSNITSAKYNYVDLIINQPRLWWPNGIGESYIYQFTVWLIYKDSSEIVDKKNIVYGIRTAELNQQNNQFTVVINGYNVYCKGANYVPPDMFYPRLTNPDYTPGNTYHKLIDDAVESHFNMIRIWGGGQYQSEQFLQIASRKGIMIFYDFMFSDSIYPSNEQFLMNVQKQVKQQVTKARNYPCVVLWSGNNQILQGIQSWGWKRPNYQEDYKKLFQQLIPKILEKYHPDVPYIASSPVHGVGNSGFSRGGDVHYWGVWAGQSPFQSYKSSIGPFNSQFGTQSLPVWETIQNFTNQDQRAYDSQVLLSHERHNSKFGTLKRYIQMYGDASKDFESEVYLSGLIQAFGVQIAIKYQRMAKPKSFGTLYWQLNDAWPAISWSSIDYFGRWKPLQYMAKRSYPDVAVFVDQGSIKAINDNLYPIEALVIVKLQKFDGSLLVDQVRNIRLQINEVKQVMKIGTKDYSDLKQDVVIFAEIIAGREKQMWTTSFFVPYKKLQLKPSKLYIKYLFDYNMLILKTDKFIKNLYISSIKKYIRLSDNYFDMIANKQYKIILHEQSLKEIKSSLLFRGYRQIHMQEPIEIIIEDEK